MSLRTRLFLLFGGLIVVLLGAQWWMWRTLSGKLDTELETVAFSVGRGVVSFFTTDQASPLRVEVEAEHTRDHSAERAASSDRPRVTVADSGDVAVEHARYEYRTTWRFISNDGDTHTRRTVSVGPDGPDTAQTRTTVIHTGTPVAPSEAGETRTEHRTTDVRRVWVTPSDPDAAPAEDTHRTVRKFVDTDGKVHVLIAEGEDAATLAAGAHPLPEVDEQTLVLALNDNELLLGDDTTRVKRIPIPKTGISESLARAQNRYLLGSLGILVLGLSGAAMAAHRFTTPLRRLAAGAQELGEGKLGLVIEGGTGGGEVGTAVRAFNHMSTRLRELDAQARDMQERAYLSELGEIADGLAHTIRNPLNTLGLSLEQLAALSPEDPRGVELAAGARRQIRRIDQWIRSFLAFASQGVAQEAPLQLTRLVQDVVLEAVQDGSKPIDPVIDTAPDLPPLVGVAPEMRAVLQALVVNAVEASPEGGTVRVALYGEAGYVCIDVEDAGAGVDPGVRDRLFTPHATTKSSGSGMGLFLAARILSTRYHGRLQLHDRPEGGTCASVRIPVSGGGLHD